MNNKIIDIRKDDFYGKNRELINVIVKMSRLISESKDNKNKHACIEGLKFIKNYINANLIDENMSNILKDDELKHLEGVSISAIEEFMNIISIRCINYINNVVGCNYKIIDTCPISCSDIYSTIGCKQCKGYIEFKTQYGSINYSISFI